ncbi:hypothetical protein LPB140_02005 [Sphingorhabdus lutea]|uniref:Uncharacterized protein n=1 Tax=Sphingorhabdus lutea TaxID=1913578 RepID=A0A1L3J9L0_9SPHN|nr:hypothetical protein [Sphingorhabdus lutea]APG61808.1 hypothetical protein LPB140_02005 [Sphingorhabdus lutea]
MNLSRERQFAEAVERYLFDAGGDARMRQIIRNLPHYIELTPAERRRSKTRPREEMWEQIVRNIVSHRYLADNAINRGKLHYRRNHLSLANSPQLTLF